MTEQRAVISAKHVYYQLKFRLQSSMLIGNGIAKDTDDDLLVDNAGRPYIPGRCVP